MTKLLYRIRLYSSTHDVWNKVRSNPPRMVKLRQSLWQKHRELTKESSYSKDEITPLFEKMEIDDRRYFEVQECVDRLPLDVLMPNMEFEA